MCNDVGASEAEEKGMCAACPRVYHARCHMPPIKRKWEDIPEDWKCMMCEDVDVHNLNPSLKNANTRYHIHKDLAIELNLLSFEIRVNFEFKITNNDSDYRKLCYKVVLSCYEHVVGVRWFTSPVPANTPYYREVEC